MGCLNYVLRSSFLFSAFLLCVFHAAAQKTISVDGREFTRYRPKYFSPHRGLFYSIYFSPVVTVDPLGFGGKSTYGMALGSQISLWESKTAENPLTGIKIRGFYAAFGHEYYPQQYSKTYASLWLRIKAFIPLAGKIDYIYASGYGKTGITLRYCAGFEVKKITIFVCGESWFYYALGGPHPNFDTKYTNAGEIMAVIPIFTRKEK